MSLEELIGHEHNIGDAGVASIVAALDSGLPKLKGLEFFELGFFNDTMTAEEHSVVRAACERRGVAWNPNTVW